MRLSPVTYAHVMLRRSRLLQAAVLIGFWLIGEGLVRAADLGIPGGIVGFLLVLGLLMSRRLRLESVKRGADWFVSEMLLFFLPAVVAIVDHGELVSLAGLKALLVIVAGTLAVMLVTALTVDLCYRWSAKHE
ncbi:CidA/LrgA family protein [Fodinicurvata halophila]|uniref:CidA/LrgA family protein n=1 Tax=Fodinicurvata halophila TaxID=1419723 RepID=A0ABV8UHG6_9PROT